METKNTPTTEERQPWHKPEIQKLTVTLDTAYDSGSNTDAHGGRYAGKTLGKISA